MKIAAALKSYLEEMREELTPLAEELDDNGMDDYSDTIQLALQKVNDMIGMIDNSELNDRLSIS